MVCETNKGSVIDTPSKRNQHVATSADFKDIKKTLHDKNFFSLKKSIVRRVRWKEVKSKSRDH